VAFPDDVALAAVAHNADLLEQLVNPILADVAQWMSANGLTLTPEKSECIVLTRKHALSTPQLHIQGFQVPAKRTIRYLGEQLDTRLSFVEHAKTVAAGAKRAGVALGRLMPNVGGPSQSKRSLLMSVVHSRLLYGAQMWADSVQGVEKPKNVLLQAQRVAALKVARSYRTVSDMAALVLARMPPAFLLTESRKTIMEARKTGTAKTKTETMREILRQWHQLWESTTKAAWTRRLIPDLERWWHQRPKTVSFHMAQALTGHGCF